MIVFIGDVIDDIVNAVHSGWGCRGSCVALSGLDQCRPKSRMTAHGGRTQIERWMRLLDEIEQGVTCRADTKLAKLLVRPAWRRLVYQVEGDVLDGPPWAGITSSVHGATATGEIAQ